MKQEKKSFVMGFLSSFIKANYSFINQLIITERECLVLREKVLKLVMFIIFQENRIRAFFLISLHYIQLFI